MSSSISTTGSTNRLTGIYSGFDTDTMVQELLTAKQTKVDNAKKDQTLYEWHNEAVESAIKTVKEFQSKYLSSTSTSSMLKSATYLSYKVDTTDTSGAVSVTGGSEALEGSISVSVAQLAKNASVSSGSKVSANGDSISSANTTALGDLSFANALSFDGDGNISFSINGADFEFSKDTSLQTMLNTVNSSEDAGVTMKYSRLTDTFTISADEGGASSQVKIENKSGNAFGADGAFGIDTGTHFGQRQDAIAYIDGVRVQKDSNEFSIDGLNYTLKSVNATETTETVRNRTFYESETGSFVKGSDGTAARFITNTETGESGWYGVDSEGDYAENAENKLTTYAYDSGTDTYVEDESGSFLMLDGEYVDTASAQRYGSYYTVEEQPTGLTSDSESVEFTVSRDYSSTIDSIKTFIEDYNTMYTALTDLVEAKDYTKDYAHTVYEPLTDAQKEDMSDEQIEKWEAKAKNGVLNGNEELTDLLASMRSLFFSKVGGTGSSLSSIGITTGNYFTDDKNKIVIDEDALKASLEKDPEKVLNMFTAYSSDAASGDAGVMYKFRRTVSSYISSAEDDVDAYETRMNDNDDKIDDLEDKLDAEAERLYSKFSAMETALAKLNSQASYISQLLSSN